MLFTKSPKVLNRSLQACSSLLTLFNTAACIWLATMHLSPTNEKMWVNKWLEIELNQANMTHLNNILTDQLLLSFKFFCFQFCLIVKAFGGIIFPRCAFFRLLLTEWPMTTVQPQSTYPLKKTLSFYSFIELIAGPDSSK